MFQNILHVESSEPRTPIYAVHHAQIRALTHSAALRGRGGDRARGLFIVHCDKATRRFADLNRIRNWALLAEFSRRTEFSSGGFEDILILSPN